MNRHPLDKQPKHGRELFRPYPAFRYKRGQAPIIVRSKKDDEVKLADGWAKTPIREYLESLPSSLKETPEQMQAHNRSVQAISAMTNSLLRLKGLRNRKQVLALADELGIYPHDPGPRLADIKQQILDQAKEAPDLKKMLEEKENADGETVN